MLNSQTMHDRDDPDQDRQVEVEARARLGPGRVGEPLGLDQGPDDEPVDRQHARPGEPVAEGRDRADEGEVLAPRLVGEERDAAGLVREHRRQLGVDVVLQRAEADRDRPEDEGAGRAQRPDRGPERGDQEPRVGERDDEAVPPRHRLEKLAAPRPVRLPSALSVVACAGNVSAATDGSQGRPASRLHLMPHQGPHWPTPRAPAPSAAPAARWSSGRSPAGSTPTPSGSRSSPRSRPARRCWSPTSSTCPTTRPR